MRAGAVMRPDLQLLSRPQRAHVRARAREAHIANPGNPRAAHKQAMAKLKEDHRTGSFMSIIAWFAIKLFISWLITKLIENWIQKRLSHPASTYQLGEPGYEA
jgi:hypothetical protein